MCCSLDKLKMYVCKLNYHTYIKQDVGNYSLLKGKVKIHNVSLLLCVNIWKSNIQ